MIDQIKRLRNHFKFLTFDHIVIIVKVKYSWHFSMKNNKFHYNIYQEILDNIEHVTLTLVSIDCNELLPSHQQHPGA